MVSLRRERCSDARQTHSYPLHHQGRATSALEHLLSLFAALDIVLFRFLHSLVGRRLRVRRIPERTRRLKGKMHIPYAPLRGHTEHRPLGGPLLHLSFRRLEISAQTHSQPSIDSILHIPQPLVVRTAEPSTATPHRMFAHLASLLSPDHESVSNTEWMIRWASNLD